MTDEKKENRIIKILKMIHEALFSPSPDDELYKPSKLLPGMVFYYLKVLCVLGGREASVQDIVDEVGTSQSNISQHLAILRDKGVLRTRKEANRV
ncbi:MAG: metalloregulator ArsR/SmtB family transcription factor, partial [Candidatus Methanoperedens sp.]|nr:metalloregulator ArsR/SmtB family transcription factor [Candidatus Methanoperedens sp.]